MNGDKLIFDLLEPKKHSGKYVLRGTERDIYPTSMYFKKDWFTDRQLPKVVAVTVTAAEE